MLNKKGVSLRPLEVADLQAAHNLSQMLGWSHRLKDWNCMLALGHGFAATTSTEELVGVALWWENGEDSASLGMVIVHPSHQRRGIGRSLLEAIIALAEPRRIQLHATAQGLRLYESLGFVATAEMRTHLGTPIPNLLVSDSNCAVRALRPSDRLAMRSLDLRASGINRQLLLASLELVSKGYLVERDGEGCGYAFCRDFGKWNLIGPTVADSELTAIALTLAAARDAIGPLQVNIPSDAGLLAAWLTKVGVPEAGRVTTMWRGNPPHHDSGVELFSLASQAFG